VNSLSATCGKCAFEAPTLKGLNVNSLSATCGNFHLKFKQLYFSTINNQKNFNQKISLIITDFGEALGN
jgi:hypothetical protein